MILLLFPTVVGAMGTYKLLYSAKGEASLEVSEQEGLRTAVKRTQDYEIHRRYSEEAGEEEFLVSSAQKIEFYLNAEGVTGEASWTVRSGADFSRRLWGKTEQATELNVHDSLPVLVTGLWGCCGSMTGYRLYNLETGRMLMPFNDFSFRNKVVQPFSLEIPNSRLSTRWLGVLSADSTRDFSGKAKRPGYTAGLLIHYVGGSATQKLQVDVPLKPGYGLSVLYVGVERDPQVKDSKKIEIMDNQVVMWNLDGLQDGRKVQGVVVRIDMDWGDGAYSLRLPLRGDQLVLPASKYEPYSIHELSGL